MTEGSESPSPARPSSTAYLVATGTALFMTMRWVFRAIGLISTIVLARLLVPDDFGLVAIAASYVALIDGLTDLSIRSSVIRHGGADRAFLDTIFTVQLLRALVVSITVLATSFVLPQIIHDERLAPVIWCLALNTLWGGLQNPKLALFERDMDFRRELAMQFVAKLLSTLGAVAIAIIYQSYWALIAGSLIGSLTRVILSYVLSPFMPRFSLKLWRELFRFAGWLSAATTFNSLGHKLDSIVVGAFLGVRSAEIYKVGSEFAGLPLDEFLPVLTRTLFPGLLKFKDDISKLRQNTLDTVELICTLSFPIAVGFAFVAPEMVFILYGTNWLDAVPIVQAISLCVGIKSIGASVTTSVAMATDNTKLLFRRSVVRSVSRVPAFVLGAWFYGIPGAIFGYFVGSVLFASANVGILRLLLETSYRAIAERIWRAFGSVIVMAIVLGILQMNIDPTGSAWANALNVAVKVAVGSLAYVLARLAVWQLSGKPEFSEVSAMKLLSMAQVQLLARMGRKAEPK